VTYELSGPGITRTDIIEYELTGSFTILDNKATVNIQLAIDSDIEQAELLIFTITGVDNGDFIGVIIQPDEIISEDIPGWQVANDRDITVALDITVTDELKEEGFARELINRIQNIRKSSDFEVTDKIIVHIEDHPMLNNVITKHKDYIASEVLAKEIVLTSTISASEMIEITDEVSIGIQVVKV
jgi:isoleucyl-tRNA synthetase